MTLKLKFTRCCQNSYLLIVYERGMVMGRKIKIGLVGLVVVLGTLGLVGCGNKEANKPEVNQEPGTQDEISLSKKQLVVNGQNVNVDGYIINGKEYYNLEDLEHTLGFTMKEDESNNRIDIQSEKDVNIYKFNPKDYRDYSLEVEYNDYEVEVDYERKEGMVQAKYVNKKTGKKIKGPDAALLIESKLLTIDYGAGEEDIINTILSNLNLDSNYREFELEIDFVDGREFEIKRKY